MSPADTDDTWLALFERLVALSGEPVVLRVLNTHGQGEGPVLIIPGELRAPETVIHGYRGGERVVVPISNPYDPNLPPSAVLIPRADVERITVGRPPGQHQDCHCFGVSLRGGVLLVFGDIGAHPEQVPIS